MASECIISGHVWVYRTNNRWRELISWHELPPKAQKEFDYIEGEDDQYSPRFVKYKGNWLDTSDVMPAPQELKDCGWYGFNADTYSSGIAYRWSRDLGQVMLATVYVKS